MIETLLALWLGAADPSAAQVEALRAAVPEAAATHESMREHVGAARLAGQLYGVDPYKLLAIAWHESGFKAKTVTHEPRHRVSCGPMTPVPKRHCTVDELTVMGGYLAGAEHYRTWLDACGGSEYCADLAYAGGKVSVATCRRGRRVRAPYTHHDVCAYHQDLSRRASVIRSALEGGT
jgi:soluble lytic murein transglycosylase-like protein